MGKNLVRNGGFLQGDADHLRTREFTAFANGVGDFACFAQADADATTLVAHNNQGAEIKTASAFDNLGGAIDEDDFFGEFLFLALQTRIALFGSRTALTPASSAGASFALLLLLLLLTLFCFVWFS